MIQVHPFFFGGRGGWRNHYICLKLSIKNSVSLYRASFGTFAILWAFLSYSHPPTVTVVTVRLSANGGHFKKYTAPLAVPITEKDCESQAAKAPEGLEVLKQRSVFCNGGCWPVGRLGKELKVVFVVERDVFFYL